MNQQNPLIPDSDWINGMMCGMLSSKSCGPHVLRPVSSLADYNKQQMSLNF